MSARVFSTTSRWILPNRWRCAAAKKSFSRYRTPSRPWQDRQRLSSVKLALIGFGNVGRAFARLLEAQRASYPFRITAIQTARHGTIVGEKRLGSELEFGPPAASIDEFLERAGADVVIELTTLDPLTGEPALTHIRKAFEHGAHVVTANKGPIAVAFHDLCTLARAAGVEFRYESTCMDGAPVFNMVRNDLPGV